MTPGIIYRCDIGESVMADPVVYRQIELNGFDSTQFKTQQVFYPSKDGTRIPMFIVKKKVKSTEIFSIAITNRHLFHFN